MTKSSFSAVDAHYEVLWAD